MLTLVINNECHRILNDVNEHRIMALIRQQIEAGRWSESTPVSIIEDSKEIDSGVLSDFFNLYEL